MTRDDVPLKDYMERTVTDLDKRVDARFIASEEAIRKAETLMRERLDAMDELIRELFRNVIVLQQSKANMDGRLVMLAAGSAILMWALTRWVHA